MWFMPKEKLRFNCALDEFAKWQRCCKSALDRINSALDEFTDIFERGSEFPVVTRA